MSTITVTGTYTVPTGQTQSFQAPFDLSTGFFNLNDSNATAVLQVNGTLTLSAASNFDGTFNGVTAAGASNQEASLIIAATGNLTIDEPNAPYSFTGFSSGGSVGNFQNAGTYSVVGATGAYAGEIEVGVQTLSELAPFTNTGSFSASGFNVIGVVAGALNNDPGVSGVFSNSGSISISATQEAEAFNIDGTQGGSIVNTGSIVATSASGAATAIHVGGAGFEWVFSISNSGTITATGVGASALYVDNNVSNGTSGSASYEDIGSPLIHLTNQGVISGLIDLGAGPYPADASQDGGQIINTGHITGAIYLSRTGAGLYDGRGGTEIGGIHLGGGTDTVYLGNDGEVAYAGAGNGTIVGGAGADFIVAGTGSATLTGGGGADTFVYRSGDGNVTITDFAHADGDQIDLSAPGFSNLSDVMANATQVGPDTVITVGSQTITLNDVTATNLQASDFVFTPVNTVFGTVSIGATDSVVLEASDSISITSGPLAQFTGQSGGSLTNHGSMTLTTTSAGQAGVTSFNGGGGAVFENDGSFSVTGRDPTGVSGATTHNSGTFTVIDTDTSAGVGGAAPLATWGATGDVVNSGSMTIQGVGATWGILSNGTFQNLSGATVSITSATASVYGVSADQDFENDGQLTVSAALSALGVETWAGAADPLINSGTITVTGASSIGIQIEPGQSVDPGSVTLQNSGTITAQIAIQSVGSLDADIVNTGVINGVVQLGVGTNTVDSHAGTINGAIQLAGGSNTVTLGAENDVVSIAAGNNVVDGGGGTNTVSYASATSGVHVSLDLQGQWQSTGASTDTLTNFQNLVGSAFNDTLEGGGSASSTLTGGGGADTFVYRPGDGNVAITDFSAADGDVIDLSAVSGVYTLADVLADAAQVGSDTVITLGSGSLRLEGVAETSLTLADFHLGPNPLVGPPATVVGSSGNNFTVTLPGVLQQYTVAAGGTGVSGGPGNANDVLSNINRIQFVDGYEAYSTTDTAAEVYRLYEAVLNRAPDPEGLSSWTTELNNGTSLQTVANGIITSSEFQADYGSLSDSSFITLLYMGVLHRGADVAGFDYWLGEMNSGAMTRAQVLLGFSQSPEYIADLAAPVQQGLWVGNPNAAEVARLYDTTLGRLPDAAGLAYWTNQLQTGTSLQTVVNGFVGSPEFQADYGQLDNTGFVTLLYSNVLHRAPDTAGLNYWLGELSSSAMTRAQVVLGFSDSPEHITDTAPHIDNGIWLA